MISRRADQHAFVSLSLSLFLSLSLSLSLSAFNNAVVKRAEEMAHDYSGVAFLADSLEVPEMGYLGRMG